MNRIILMNNADPGYDFIFTYKIKGLITMYGGSNSHMSIRCSELSVCSIIGIGRERFRKILKSKNIQINSIQKNYKVIN